MTQSLRASGANAAVDTESRIQLERRILATLCAAACEAPAREAVLARLFDYRWTDAAHRAIFEIMTSFPAANGDVLRQQLPARLTRRGFPDFDFDCMFSAPTAVRQEVENWVAQLSGINS